MNLDEILDALEDSREQFLDAIDGIPNESFLTPGVIGEWSIKDLIAHLCAWEAELVKLLWQITQAQKPSTAHFTQNSVDETNASWQQLFKDRLLEKVLADFEAVRKQTTRRIEAFSDEDLNDPQRYSWQKQTPLWEWIANDSYLHETEHAEQIRAWRSRLGI